MENRILTEIQLKDIYFKYSWCLVKIATEDNLGNLHLGTGFYIGNGLIATARHLVDNKKIKSIDPEVLGEPVAVKKICISKNEENPIAILETNPSLDQSLKLVFISLG